MNTLTIGEVIDALKKADQTANVYFDFCGIAPTTVDSWRGIYAEAALGFVDTGRYGDSPTVASLVSELEKAIDGREFTGWKGGEYRYSRSTPLHVDNPGCCSYTDIERVQNLGYSVIIHTRNNEE